MDDTAREVLTGYDGCPASERALVWAAQEATLRGAVLTVAHAWEPCMPAAAGDDTAFDRARHRGELLLDQGIAHARSLMPHGEVHALLGAGPPARVLGEQGHNPVMVVLGSRDLGGIAELSPGSVCSQLAAHAHAPVVTVRGHLRPPTPHTTPNIIVGIDGSTESETELAFAFEEAHLHQVPLTVMWLLGEATAGTATAGPPAHLDQAVAPWQAKYADVQTRRLVVDPLVHNPLLLAASQAWLLVIGIGGRDPTPAGLPRSVSEAIVREAPCPVAVLHHPQAAGR